MRDVLRDGVPSAQQIGQTLDTKRYSAKSLKELSRKVLWSPREGWENVFSLSGSDEVLCTVDSTAPCSPIEPRAIWPIEVHGGIHAVPLAQLIWDQLEWWDIAPDDGETRTLEGHIIRCGGSLDDPSPCIAVNSLDPYQNEERITATGWWCRQIVWLQ